MFLLAFSGGFVPIIQENPSQVKRLRKILLCGKMEKRPAGAKNGGNTMFKAVCFDFDYTLGDCTDSIVAGFQYGLTGLGWPAPDREAVRRTVGFLLEDAYAMLTGDSAPARQAQFRTLFTQAALERQRRETILFPGAAERLRALKAQGIKTAIVSTKRGDTIQIILERLGLADTVDLVIGSADVTRHKPDPEGLLAALDRLGVKPEDALFCGDTVLDAEAAKNAGTRFAAVLLGTTPAEAFARFFPDHTSPDLWDLAAWLGL